MQNRERDDNSETPDSSTNKNNVRLGRKKDMNAILPKYELYLIFPRCPFQL
jgi:hypothetical protein